MTEPFYFMRYSEIIGKAENVKELRSEVSRLSKQNPESIEYHIREGHLNRWLSDIGKTDIANRIEKDTSIKDLLEILKPGSGQTTAKKAVKSQLQKSATSKSGKS